MEHLRQLGLGATQGVLGDAVADQVPHPGFEHVCLVADDEGGLVDQCAGEGVDRRRVEGVVVVADDDLHLRQREAHHRVWTGAVGGRPRDEVLGVEQPVCRRVERQRLGLVALLWLVREVLCVEGTELGVLELGCPGGVRCGFARRRQVLGVLADAGLLGAGLLCQSRRGGVTGVSEVAGTLAESLTAVVHVRVVDTARVLAAVRADVGLPDEGERRHRGLVLGQVGVHRPDVGLELSQLLFDTRECDHSLVPRVGVPDQRDTGGEREHRLAGAGGAL